MEMMNDQKSDLVGSANSFYQMVPRKKTPGIL
jgi:hypothetical protein